jgi:beta-lactamase class A
VSRRPGSLVTSVAVYPLLITLLAVISSAAYPEVGVASASSSAARHASQVVPPPAEAVSIVAPPLPPPPIATVLAPSALDQLRADLGSLAAASGGRVGISLQELSGPRRISLSIGGNQVFYAASAYKLPLLMAEAQQIAAGQVSPGDTLCYDPTDQEDGWFTDYNPGRCFSRQALAQRVGLFSDNTAAHMLVRYLGGPDVLNAYARSFGMRASALWIPNTTTPGDLAAAWTNEALGRLGGAGAWQWLLPLLTHTASEQGIPAGLPAVAVVSHKVGTFNGSENDSAYVTSGAITYVLSVAVDGTDEASGWKTIAQISARVWRYESSRPAYVRAVRATPAPPLWPDRRH